MRKIVIASDSFKGSLSSSEVADSVEKGILRAYPDCKVVKLTLADGGEGTAEALHRVLHGEVVAKTVKDPLGRPVEASYVILSDRNTAVVEIASASGLTRLEPHERNPLLTTTYGTGELIMDALKRGCRRIIVGLGGSATNDAGIGLLTAMGFIFRQSSGRDEVPNGASMLRVYEVDSAMVPECVQKAEYLLACDVRSPFMGRNGAAFMFGPQKGASDDDVLTLNFGLMNIAEAVMQYNGVDVGQIEGAGAAGGAAGTMAALLGARVCSGADLVLGVAGLGRELAGADMVITGEGRTDVQTFEGKLPFKVVRMAAGEGIPALVVCGSADADMTALGVDILPVTPEGMPLEEAMKAETASANIADAVYKYLSGRRL